MRVESRECLLQRDVQKPMIMLEGNMHTSANTGRSQAPIALEFTEEDFAQVRVGSKAQAITAM